jgi:hypothetical protein
MQSNNREFPCYLAVGFPLGAEIVPNRNEKRAGVRIGGKYISLDYTVFSLWGQALTPVTDDDIIRWYQKEDIENAWELVDWLQQRRLLVKLTGNTQKDAKTMENFKVFSLGIGLGNSVDEPDKFVIATPTGDPLVAVDFVSYAVWSFCDGTVTLSEACLMAADHLKIPLEEVTARAIKLLPILMKYRAIYLDDGGDPQP